VIAYDHPSAESDLAVYRSKFGLPPCRSTGSTPCFRKVGQNGTSKLPRPNASWAQETALDLAMVSATCPNCRILLVEADSNSMANLGIAVDRAALMGANIISNSYGGAEFSTETGAAGDGHFNHPGTVITASSGDSGYGASYPAASKYVVSVGGTKLVKNTTVARGWTETAWAGAGSGCSAYEAKPAWQTDSGCARRTISDVSAIADPATGVAVYDSYQFQGRSGWMVFGGTSVSAPLVAGVYGLAGNAATVNGAASLYANAASLFDVTLGSNGSCGGSYLCTAVAGFDGPTGLGSPLGTAAF
jgi:subtilase family serine protease